MAENNEIPENADKILFAEDLMNYVLNHTVGIPYSTRTAERYRNFIYNAFNDVIKGSVSLLYNKVDMQNVDIFFTMLDENSVNIDSYMMYSETILQKYFSEGFDASCFLHYCVRLASMAVYFYNHGIRETPTLAVGFIVNALNTYDMTTGGWDTLNTVGRKFANMENDTINELSPQLTSDEEASSPNYEQNQDKSGASNPILITAGSSFYLTDDHKEYEVPIKKIFVEEFLVSSNSGSSPGTELREDSKELKGSCSTSSANSSSRLNFEQNEVVDDSLSRDTFSPGTSNTTEKYSSVKDDCNENVALPLKEVKHENDQNMPSPTSENEFLMLEEISDSLPDSPTSIDEENNFPNKDGS